MKPRVLIVGSFRRTAGDDRIGGVGFACQSLVNSTLADSFEFLRVDSTMHTIRARSGLRRVPAATVRVARSLWILTAGGAGTGLCFASYGNSFIEKGLIVLLGTLLGRRMILLPRSGHLLRQVEQRPWFRRYVRLVLRRASVVICQSESWRVYFSGLIDGSQHSKFLVVENWLPDEAFVAAGAPISGAGSAGICRVGYLNRVERDKGVHDFIDAVRLAHAGNPAIRGVIYGDGSEVDAVRVRLRSEGLDTIVSYHGWVDGDLKYSALRALDAYLFVSHAEGFPNSLLEALALKVPAVSVRVGAVVDVLDHRRSGMLADVGDVPALAAHLTELAANHELRRQLAESAYRRVAEHNGLPRMVRRFREILATRGPLDPTHDGK